MTRWQRIAALLLAAGCARGTGGPVDHGPSAPPAPAPAPAAERRPPPRFVRYGPSAISYLLYRQLRIEQSFGGQQQHQELGARVFVDVAITGPADSTGYPTTFTVDSVLPDSGTPPPIAESMSKVRALVIAGRLAPRGDFQASATSDTAGAQGIAQLVGNFRDFIPRIPAEGVQVGTAWTDTLALTQRSGNGAVTRRATVQSTATAWENHAGTRSLRVESTATYTVTGSGQNGGQPFEVSGTGTTTEQAFISEDGRYLGGEAHDSTSLTVTLPVQSMAIPVTQVLHSTVSVRP